MSNQPEFSVSENEILADLLASDKSLSILKSIIAAAKATLDANGRVLFETTYSGRQPSEVSSIFTTRDQFESWINQINALRAELERPLL
jgi:hypothetical protein